MRPGTLKQTAERVASGQSPDKAIAEFLDEFYLTDSPERRGVMLSDEPLRTGDKKLDALLGAIAEYLAHQFKLPQVPAWACSPMRHLDRAWHVSSLLDDGFREYLTFASPAEFASRNIFTEERPLRRARGPQPMDAGNELIQARRLAGNRTHS
jgi:hypothetical protein